MRARWSNTPRVMPPAASTTATTAAATPVTRTRIDTWRGRRSASIGFEPVAVAAHRFDGVAAEGDIDLPAQVPDVDLDHVGIHVVTLVPDVAQQYRLRLHLSRVEGEEGEQLELLGCQRHRRSTSTALTGGQVNPQIAQLDCRCR